MKKKTKQSVFELDQNIEKFGGAQKFVLAKRDDDFILGSFPGLNHSEILAKLDLDENYHILGGGLFQFYNGAITIDTTFHGSKLGSINIANPDLNEIFQNNIGNKYKI